MPHALLPLPDVYESVIRRVAVAVTADLARLMRLSSETQVYLPGNTDSVAMNGGMFGNCCAPSIRYPADSRLVVRYQEEVDDNATLTQGINNIENLPLFHDEMHDVIVRPVWRYVNFTLTLEYTAPSIVIAQRWLDEQRARISMGQAERYTSVEYHYAAPRTLIALLKTLHDTMESSDFPSGTPFEQWLGQNLKVPTTNIATLIGTNNQLSFVEKQVEVLGWFDFQSSPATPERAQDGSGAYVVTMAYTFRYNRPTHVFCRFPYLMNQNPIPRALREREPFDNHRRVTRRVSRTKFAFDSFIDSYLANKLEYVHYPENDEWLAPEIPKGRLTFFSGLVVLDKDDRHSVVDLAEMGSMHFTPWFLEYFYHQGNKLFTPGDSIFEFRLYENNRYLSGHELELVPGTTMIRSVAPLDPQRYYHIQVSLVRNWYEIRDTTLQCLRRYPTVLYNVLKALGIHLDGGPLNLPFLNAAFNRAPSEDCPGEGSILCTGDYPHLAWSEGTPEHNFCPLVIRKGIIKLKALEDWIDQLDIITDRRVDRQYVGPLRVLYADILTFNRQDQ